MTNNSKLRADLENWEGSIVSESWDLVLDYYDDEAILPDLFQSVLETGIINYQLGNVEQTRLWFAWGVRALAEFLPTIDTNSLRDDQVGVPQYAENAVVRAVLIGQPQLRKQAIESVGSIDPDIRDAVDWDPRLHMTLAFAALATGDDEKALTHVETLRERADDLPDDDREWRQYFQQLAVAIEALLSEESATLETELDALLALSDDVAREMYDRSDVMDHRSGALVVLARERGLPVEPEGNEYLPTDLIELVAPLEDVA